MKYKLFTLFVFSPRHEHSLAPEARARDKNALTRRSGQCGRSLSRAVYRFKENVLCLRAKTQNSLTARLSPDPQIPFVLP
jgi:hypothetical protein